MAENLRTSLQKKCHINNKIFGQTNSSKLIGVIQIFKHNNNPQKYFKGVFMRKNFVLDTNIILHDPTCFNRFDEHNIHLLFPVIEELENHKGDEGETGYNAREFARIISKYRETYDLTKGVPTPGGGKIFFYYEDNYDLNDMPPGWDKKKVDNIILWLTKGLAKKRRNVALVSNDTYMLLKADLLSLPAEHYKNDRAGKVLYTGREIYHLNNQDFAKLMAEGELKYNKDLFWEKDDRIEQGMYITVKTWENGSALTQVNGEKITLLQNQEINPCDISPRNAGQRFLIESLMKPVDETPLICVNGPAGTGKTLLALAAGLHQVMETKQYETVLLCRANVMMGGKQEELGALPGTEFEKISPLFRSIYDNCRIIFGPEDIDGKIEELFYRKFLDAQALAYIRGRSIENTFIILDEAQNCTPSEMLAITTRLGRGSRLCVIGDTNQIDNPRLDSRNNGLSFIIDRMGPHFKNSKGERLGTSRLTDIVTFTEKECQRSPLAKEASERMKL